MFGPKTLEIRFISSMQKISRAFPVESDQLTRPTDLRVPQKMAHLAHPTMKLTVNNPTDLEFSISF